MFVQSAGTWSFLRLESEMTEKREEQPLHGPFSDAMTHVGQLAMLRRFAGFPVAPENFIVANIRASNLGTQQPTPSAP